MARNDLTAARLRELVNYDPATGLFVWLARSHDDFSAPHYMRVWNTKNAGKIAGHIQAGRRIIRVFSTNYYASQLAFLFMTGEIPPIIDHIDREPSNDAFRNLRAVSSRQNRTNARGRVGRHGFKGVYPVKAGTWKALVTVNGESRYLGCFSSDVEAALAYDAAAIEIHGAFAATNASMGLLPIYPAI